MNFSELSLTRPLLRAVEEQGYTQPSPIQAKAIPPVLEGRDLLGCAQTGTGKTAAFALPMLQLLAARRPARSQVRALVLTPTRELALQIGESFAQLGKYTSIRHTVVFGGVGQGPQAAAMAKGVDVLIACPGRLNDLIGQGLADLSGVEIFVLDEADRMLDMGFVHDVKRVMAKLPAQRQNLMFSATMPKEIEQLADSFLHRPVTVKVDPPSSTVDRIEQTLYPVCKADKRRLLVWLLNEGGVPGALVFSRTKHGADRIAKDLTRAGVSAAAIHGNKSQSARVAALEGFKNGSTRVLVATDIAARGIDINELSHVINFDLPEVPETYVHRIGRTARAGKSGVAISFCCPEEQEYLAGIEKLIRKKLTRVTDHPFIAAANEPAPPPAPRPPRGARLRPQAPAAQTQRNEEPIVEEKKPSQPQPAQGKANQGQPAQGEALSASAKRRRRRHRAAAAAQQGQNQAPQQAAKGQKAAQPQQKRGQQPQRQQKPTQPQQQKKAQPQRPAKQNAQKGQQAPQRPERETEPRTQRAAAQPPKAERPQPAQRPARSRGKKAEEDPGLLLISRRPPAQKFASFEEYIQSHGGVTAPIEGDGEE
ncbi:MAG: DEAD/DEAH box helicase [Oscillospiraceae bacterium]|nr:DEAD/DEAH box helicase [Bacteroidales bacterium]MDY5095479.1 DEAD/DEAH box helicase [Oscillospiraceae bacterium]